MSPSVLVRAQTLVILAFAFGGSGCTTAKPFAPVEVRHAAAERVVAGDAVEVELQSTRYLERGVTVAVMVRNKHDAALELDRSGLLLGVAELEFPLDPQAKLELPSTIAGNAEAVLRLQFATGTPIDEGATLHLRALRREGRWLRVPPLAVSPAPIAAPDPGVPASPG